MIAIDGSGTSDNIFNKALIHIKPHDEVTLITIIEEPSVDPFLFSYPAMAEVSPVVTEHKQEAMKFLGKYLEQCLALKIHCSRLVLSSNNVGEMLCIAAAQQRTDFFIMGKSKSASWLNSWVYSTTSQHCMNNLTCNILFLHENSQQSEQETEIQPASVLTSVNIENDLSSITSSGVNILV